MGHSNEGDFDTFASEKHAEALKDRIIAIQVPYALKVSEEIKIYEKIIEGGAELDVHLAPLTLRVASTYTVLSRIDPSSKQALSLLDKVRLYDGEVIASISKKEIKEMRRHQP